jgi:hypothetical protein
MDSAVWREIEKLQSAGIDRLRMKYREVFHEEPRWNHKEQLFRRIAWRMQALAEGGLSKRARQRADEIAEDADLRVLMPRVTLDHTFGQMGTLPIGRLKSRYDRRIPPPGSQLSREYRGNQVQVNVLADGFEYEGRRYRSLSAIAWKVTGTRWNGLAFFRLTGDTTGRKGRSHAGNS